MRWCDQKLSTLNNQYIECLSAAVPCPAKVGVGTGLSLAAIVCPSIRLCRYVTTASTRHYTRLVMIVTCTPNITLLCYRCSLLLTSYDLSRYRNF